MIIDDDLDIVRILAAILRNMGITDIRQEKNPVAALELLKEEKFVAVDLIICDWMMPKLSGLDILKEVRAANPEVPFLMITAKTDTKAVRAAMENQVSAYIAKPFTPDQVIRKVTALLDLA